MTVRLSGWSLVVPAAIVLAALAVSAPAAAFPERSGPDREWAASGRGEFVLADLTGDGFDDLAAVDDAARAVRVHVGTDAGIPLTAQISFTKAGVTDLATADMNGDGRSDLVAVGDGEATWVDLGAIPRTTSFVIDGLAVAVAPGDFDGDGDTDLAILGADSARVWFQLPAGFDSATNLSLAEGESFQGIAAGDVNGDGRDDVVLVRPFELRAYLQGALGLDLEPVRISIPAFGDVALALLPTAHSRPYVAVLGAWDDTFAGVLGLWTWDGGTFQLAAAVQSPFARRIAVGDVNDDRRADVVLARTDGNTDIFLQGAGGVPAIPNLLLTAGTTTLEGRVGVGDVNGDGFGDVVLRSESPNRFFAYLQEDAPPTLVNPIPSTFAVNRGAYEKGSVDLREYFADDHDRLTFELVASSNESLLAATVEGSVLSFQASSNAYGVAEFRVAAWDENPGHAWVEGNPFMVVVNDLPAVVGVPPLRAIVGRPYAYVIRVADAYPAGEGHTFALFGHPAGMSVDAATGLVTWTPASEQVGAHNVSAEVRDEHGGVVLHAFTVVVAPALDGSPLFLMAVGLVGTSAALLAAAALLNENAKWAFLLFFLPLYSKIKRERVLDHFVRGQIFGYIQANPGEHYNAIKDALGLTNGSLAHHLRTLEREQFVKSRRFGLYRRFYPMHYRIPDQEEFQPNEVQRTILDVIRQSPGITQKEIATRLRLTPPTVNYHIAVLIERNRIHVERRGRSTHCSIVDGPT